MQQDGDFAFICVRVCAFIVLITPAASRGIYVQQLLFVLNREQTRHPRRLNDWWAQQSGFTGSPVMQTKSPFSCRDRSPSDANVTGLNNRRDACGVRSNRRVEARSGAWCRRSSNIDITEPSILNNSQEGSNVVLLQPQSGPANQENPAHPNYGR